MNISCDNFKVTPNAFKQLSEQIISVAWKHTERTVSLDIKETSSFDVLRWMDYIDQQNTEQEKSPFVNIDVNFMNLTLFDEEGKEVVTLKFKNLELKDHHCNMYKNTAFNAEAYFVHHLQISYENYEKFVAITIKYPEQKDEEWQTGQSDS